MPFLRNACWLLLTALVITSRPVAAEVSPKSQGGLASEQPGPVIAIIIDDMGNSHEWGQKAILLPAPLTLAFLPGRPFTRAQAELAHQVGKEVMLHAPMENTRQLPLGAMALTSRMNNDALSLTLRRAIQSVPHVSGVNNHMGSLLTSNRPAMSTIMGELRQHPLYFVDSRTSASSVAYEVAKGNGIPSLARDVFLDHVISYRSIHHQFQRLLQVARKNGSAIAIGHPHPETLRYLERALPRLGEQGISVATVKGLWALRNQSEMLFPAGSGKGTVLAQLQDQSEEARPPEVQRIP